MKIVVLDGYTANPGDLNWDDLAALGELHVYERTSPEEIIDRAQGAEVLLTNKTKLTRPLIESLPELRYIGVLATGYNVVDVEAAKERDITVTNVPAYSTASTAQATFALLLELTNQVGYHSETVHAGRWVSSPDFAYWDRPLVELSGLTMGIVGFGSIGKAVANLAIAFGMNVLVHTRTVPATSPSEKIRFCDVDMLFAQSDVVSLHCPLTEATQGMVNAERLEQMKPSAFLLNAGRGPLVDEAALAHALNSGKITGAGLDVLSAEPPTADNPLLTARNCIITPHISWATRASRLRLIDIATKNVQAFLAGNPLNVVS